MELKKTFLNDEHRKLNAKMVAFSGWDMPIQYTGITEEHLSVREDVGIFDVSHMGEVTVKGIGAERFVQYLITNDVTAIEENKVLYTFMCNENGGVVDDLLVYKYNKQHYLLVINAANIDKDFAWIKKVSAEFDVEVINESDSYSEVAVQGPNAQKTLQQLTDFNLDEITFFTFRDKVMVAGIECIVSRTGYTGEDGFEVYCDNENIVTIWNLLLEKGAKPIGLGARDTLRFEAALPLYGNELNDELTPLESGFGFFVKLDTDFVGKDVIADLKEKGLPRKIVGIKLLDKGIPRHGYEVANEEGETIGTITTGYLLPNHESGLALALVDAKYSTLGTKIAIKVRKKLVAAEVVSKKFINKNYKK